MAKARPLNFSHGLIVATVAVAAANYLSVQLIEYPFLYCWTEWWLRPLYLSWGSILLYVLVLWIVYALFRKTFVEVLIGCGLFMTVIELPRLLDYLFRQGASCG